MSSFLVILVSVVCLLSNARRKINNPCMYPYTLWYARWRIVSTSCVVLAMADDLPSLQASSHVAGAKRNRVPSVLCGMTRKGHGTNQVQRYLVRSACSMKRSLTLVKKLNAVVKRLQTETKLLSMSHPRVKGHEKLLCKHLCSQSGEVFYCLFLLVLHRSSCLMHCLWVSCLSCNSYSTQLVLYNDAEHQTVMVSGDH